MGGTGVAPFTHPPRDAAPAKRSLDLLLLIAALVMCAMLLFAAIPLGRPALPRRFAEVEPGRLYRGGIVDSPAALRRIRDRDHIRTVVDLTNDASKKHGFNEAQAATQLGLQYRSYPMPGNGTGDFDALDAAADAIADERNQPVFFHCSAGKQRGNAALAAYRMRHCGWTIDQALSELDEKYELDRRQEAKLIEHLRRYYAERILPKRASTQTAPTGRLAP